MVSDTIKFIPFYIPFPETDINDHVRKTLLDLAQLFHAKQHPFPATTYDSSKQAIIKISQLLDRDKAKIPPLPNTTSEGVGVKIALKPKSRNHYKVRLKPLTDEEFDKLIKSVKTSPKIIQPKLLRKKSPKLPPSPQLLFYNIPTPKQKIRPSLSKQ